MNLRNVRLKSLLRRRSIYASKRYSSTNVEETSMKHLCKHLSLSESNVQYICLKYPVLRNINEAKVQDLVNTVRELGFDKNVLIEEPSLFSILPQTLRLRYQVLDECGIQTINKSHLLSYLTLVKHKTVYELKKSNDIPFHINVENRLAGYMTQWPTSLTTLILGDVNNYNLYDLRLKILQRYLELVLDLTNNEFDRGLQTYPTIRHRPLKFINKTLSILKSEIMMPINKIKSNLYLIHVDPENLKDIMYNLQSLGGLDIKEVIRSHPKLATKRCSTMMEMKKLLNEYGIDNEAQRRCFDIYTLAPSTVRERLENAKSIPEFNTFLNHPRFLKMIHYNKTALNRLRKSFENNKKCLSLNILSGSSAHYEIFEKSPGDRLGKGKDLLFCVSQSLGKNYGMNEIRRILKRHPFWINVPLVQVQYVCEKLSKEFSHEDIYFNCPIILYPWDKIRDALKSLKTAVHSNLDHLDFNRLGNRQKLSLVLYALEKKHYFSGNGVWAEDKTRNIICPLNKENIKQSVPI